MEDYNRKEIMQSFRSWYKEEIGDLIDVIVTLNKKQEVINVKRNDIKEVYVMLIISEFKLLRTEAVIEGEF